jgi:hypothetical protein
VGLPGLEHVVLGDGQVPGQFEVIGGTAELLRQGLLGGAHLQQQFLVLAADPDLPAPVAEMPFDLATDTWLGVGGQAVPEAGVEAVDGLEQADVADLQQVLGRFGALPVGPTQERTSPA